MNWTLNIENVNVNGGMCAWRATKAHQTAESARRRGIIEEINAERLEINNQIEGNLCNLYLSSRASLCVCVNMISLPGRKRVA